MSQIIIDTNDDVEVIRALIDAAALVADAQEARRTSILGRLQKSSESEPSKTEGGAFPEALGNAPESTVEESTASEPTAPSIATAPIAATVSPSLPTVAAAPELDSEGLPWDHRIHSSGKTRLKADNTWKLKAHSASSGKTKEEHLAYVDEVKNELRVAMGVPAVEPVAQAAPNVPAQPAQPAQPAPVAQPVVSPLPVQPVAPVVQPAPSGVAWDFASLVQAIATDQTGRFTEEFKTQALAAVGLTALPQLAQRPDLVPAVAAALGL